MPELSDQSKHLISFNLAMIQELTWDFKGLIENNATIDWVAVDKRLADISGRCHMIRSELAYNVGVQKMPERKKPASEPKPRASIDDIFGSL